MPTPRPRSPPTSASEQVADIYAAALLGATEKAGQTAAVLDEFDALVGEVFPQFPKLEAILASSW